MRAPTFAVLACLLVAACDETPPDEQTTDCIQWLRCLAEHRNSFVPGSDDPDGPPATLQGAFSECNLLAVDSVAKRDFPVSVEDIRDSEDYWTGILDCVDPIRGNND